MLKPDLNHITPPLRWSLASLIGLLLTCLGLVVMCGWVFQVRAMVEFRTGLVAMTFNTALCFTLAGLCLLLPAVLARPLPRLQQAVGVFLIVLATTVLVEHINDINLGVDWAFLHAWLRDGNIRPGRLAPNTALGFIMTGICLVLLPRIDRRWRELLFQVVLFCLLAIGLTGLIGYVLSPDQLFGWARSARMAVHTAVGMMLLAVGLWSKWHIETPQSAFLTAEEKIAFMSAAILCVVSMASGLTGFVFQQTILENALRDKLQFRLNDQISLFSSILVRASNMAENAAEDERLLNAAARFAQDSASQKAHHDFILEVQRLLHNGFQSVSLLAPDGHVLYAPAGAAQEETTTALTNFDGILHARHARMDLPGNSNLKAALIWDGQLKLRTDGKLVRGEQVLARLVLTQHLPVMQTLLFDLHGLGQTGELSLCAGQQQKLLCMPSGRQSEPYLINRTNFTGQPLPMNFAVKGETGLIATFDYKGNNVMAAYGPIGPNLGLVVKQDTAELYAVIRTQLKFVIPTLLLLTVLGAWLMRSQIRPLAQRLSASEIQARERQIEINTVVNSVGEGIMTISAEGIIESFNPAAAAIFGYATHEVIGQPLAMLQLPELPLPQANMGNMANMANMPNMAASGPAIKLEVPGQRRDGSIIMLELTINEIRFASRQVFVGVVHDITERKQFEEKLIFLAQYDVLTGLPNRALFMDRLSGAMLRASRNQTALAVMFLDLDGFKHINDTLGHHCGDALLKQFGTRLVAAVRKSDSVARLAGDEFTVILEGLHQPEQDTREVAEKIIAAMQLPFTLGEQAVQVTTSIGLAIHTAGGTDLENLLRRADDAMYRAKQSGKNRWCV